MTNNSNNRSMEDLKQDDYMLILYSFLYDLPENEWNEFVHGLTFENRFYSSHKIIDVISRNSENQTRIIEKGKELYRSRIYHQDPFRVFLSNCFDRIDINDKFLTEGEDILCNYYNTQMAVALMAIENKTLKGKEILDNYEAWKRKRFKGYSAKDSGAPPSSRATSGRINPDKISYLYLAEEPETSVYEVRPMIGQYVSVAKFKVMEPIKVYDMCWEDNSYQEDKNENWDIALCEVIQKHFSELNEGDPFKYLPTQYLGEMIKRMGFDGLRFKSSLKQDGINVVLFDDRKCKAVRSDIVQIGGINLEFKNPDIYAFDSVISDIKNRA